MSFACLFVACACAACAAYEFAAYVCGKFSVTYAGVAASLRKVTPGELLEDPLVSLVLFEGAACAVASSVSLWLLPPFAVLAFVASRKAPSYLEKRRQQELRSACDGELDVLADIVAMGSRAGLSFDAALELYCERFNTTLSREMRSAALCWKGGFATREKALMDCAKRVDSGALRRFADTVVHAMHYGAPLAGSLTRFADELRHRRKASIERQVEKAPVKMLLPMGLFILPAMLILVMGPVVLQFLGSGI